MKTIVVASPINADREPLAGLDLTRFAAALLVALYHLTAVSASTGDAELTRIINHSASYPEIFPRPVAVLLGSRFSS